MKVKSSIIRDTIEIEGSNGEVIKSIPFSFNVAESGRRANQKLANVLALQKKSAVDDETLGNAIIETFKVYFGDNATAELLDYYKDDYVAMLCDVLPIITELIIPRINEWNSRLLEQNKRAKFRR